MALLSNSSPVAAGVALAALDELAKAKRLPAVDFLASCPPVFRLAKKAQPIAALKIVQLLLKQDPKRAPAAAAAVVHGLGNDSADVQEKALDLLNSFLERGTSQFPSVLFRWHLALIRIARATGERETVQRAARTALDLAGRGPVFPRHKTVGVVRADAKTLKRLRKLAK